MLDAVDHQYIDRTCCWYQLQSKLFLNRGKQRWPIRVDRLAAERDGAIADSRRTLRHLIYRTTAPSPANPPLQVVLNWFEELKQLVPVK